jgi:hypothetical protein
VIVTVNRCSLAGLGREHDVCVLSDATFPIFRVAQWDGGTSNGMTTHSGRTLFDRSSGTPTPISHYEVMSSSSHRHHREPDNGEFIVITSQRPRDAAERDDDFGSIEDMLVAILENEVGCDASDGAWDRRMREYREGLAEGHIPVELRGLLVDGTDVEFRIVSLGEYTAAWASLDTVTIQMWSRRVSLDGLSLVSEPDQQHS